MTANIDRIIRKPEAALICGLSIVTIYRLEKDGKFPRRKKLGNNAVGWLLSDIQAWLESRPEVIA